LFTLGRGDLLYRLQLNSKYEFRISKQTACVAMDTLNKIQDTAIKGLFVLVI